MQINRFLPNEQISGKSFNASLRSYQTKVSAEKWAGNGLTSCLLVKEYGFACKFNNGFVVNQKKALPLPLIFERGNIKSNLLIKTNLVLTILEWKI